MQISATDIHIQVVFRGTLGDELDSIAVGTRDISEPTYWQHFSRVDQYRYRGSYPIMETVNDGLTFEQWCGGFATLNDCRVQTSPTFNYRFHKVGKPPAGYDPINSTFEPNELYDVKLQPPFAPHAALGAPTGSIARIAILADLEGGGAATVVRHFTCRQIEPCMSNFSWWDAGVIVPTINQMDVIDGTLTPSTRYAAGRGIYIWDGMELLLNDGEGPNLIIYPSTTAF